MSARALSVFRLPRLGAAAAGHLRIVAAQTDRATLASRSTGIDPTRRHIVAVDDAPEIRELLADLLQSEGYRVSMFAAPPPPRELTRLAPDLIVLDLLYNGECSGLDYIAGLRADPTFRALPMVVCTGASDIAQQAEAALALFDVEVVLKPFDIDALLAEIGRQLARRS